MSSDTRAGAAYRTVVVGTDGSSTAEMAVEHAARLAAVFAARLVVVTAFTPGDDTTARRSNAPEDIRWMLTDRNLAEERARRGRELARGAGAGEVVVQSVAADAAEGILEVARDFDADVIVVGSKGLTSPARFVLGSVASTVSHHAPCDVLIVHTV